MEESKKQPEIREASGATEITLETLPGVFERLKLTLQSDVSRSVRIALRVPHGGVNSEETAYCCRRGKHAATPPKIVLTPKTPRFQGKNVSINVDATHPCGIFTLTVSFMEVVQVGKKEEEVLITYTKNNKTELMQKDFVYPECTNRNEAITFPFAPLVGSVFLVKVEATSCCLTNATEHTPKILIV